MADIQSYGFVLREAPQIIASYQKAKVKGAALPHGYLNAASRCADSARAHVLDYSERQVPPGTVTRIFGAQCASIVTLLVRTHSYASTALLNQMEADKYFCHARTFNRLQKLVAVTLETTGQGRVIFPDTNRSMAGTVRELVLDVPKFAAESGLVTTCIVPRPDRPVLSLPQKSSIIRDPQPRR